MPKTLLIGALIAIVVIAVAATVYYIYSKGSTTTSTTTPSPTTAKTTTTGIPAGAYQLPYNSANRTVFLYIVTLSSASNTFNYNGTSNGKLIIYVPANWTLIVYYTNYQSINHNLVIVKNSTVVPTSSNLAVNGKILLVVGSSSGISGGKTAIGSISLSEGIYWFACGMPGHAQAGMWGVIVVSTSVTVPYAVIA